MTNHWNDLANSDCLMIIGCNPAENHPISFKWITKAMEKGVFDDAQLAKMLGLARKGVQELIASQQKLLSGLTLRT